MVRKPAYSTAVSVSPRERYSCPAAFRFPCWSDEPPGAVAKLTAWRIAGHEPCVQEPQDDAESFATEIESTPESDADRVEAAHVGGPFVTERFYRPVL